MSPFYSVLFYSVQFCSILFSSIQSVIDNDCLLLYPILHTSSFSLLLIPLSSRHYSLLLTIITTMSLYMYMYMNMYVQVSTPELAEVFSINAIAPAIINARYVTIWYGMLCYVMLFFSYDTSCHRMVSYHMINNIRLQKGQAHGSIRMYQISFHYLT